MVYAVEFCYNIKQLCFFTVKDLAMLMTKIKPNKSTVYFTLLVRWEVMYLTSWSTQVIICSLLQVLFSWFLLRCGPSGRDHG